MFNNVSNSTLAVANTAWGIIQNRVTIPRLFRITGVNGEEQTVKVNEKKYGIDMNTGDLIVRVKNDITIGEYDFEISDTPYAGNAKEIEFYKLSELLDALISIGTPKSMERADALMPILVMAGSFPYQNEIKQAWQPIDEGSPEQQQMQQMMIQLQQIMAKLGIEEKKEDVTGKKLDNVKKQIEIKSMVIDNILNRKKNGKAKQYQLN